MTKKWKIKKLDGTIYGPADIETIGKWINEKRILGQDYISQEDIETWQPIQSVPEFTDTFQHPISSKEQPSHIDRNTEPTFKVKNIKGEKYGPANFHTITKWLQEKRIDEKSLVQKTGGNEWFPLRELPHLVSLSSDDITPHQQFSENKDDIGIKVRKIVTRIKLLVFTISVVLLVTILFWGIQKTNYLNRGTTKEGINYWDYKTKVLSFGETVVVPAGQFDNCYIIAYSADISEGGKHYNINGKSWYKVGVGNVKEEFTRSEASKEFNLFDTLSFSGELTSYKGPGAGNKPFPYISGAQLKYDLTAKIDVQGPLEVITSVAAPPQEFKIIMTCTGTITLEDGKKYLKVIGTAGGPITRSEEFYRIEGNNIFFYGTRYMRNASSPVKTGTLEPKVGNEFENKITFDGTYSSTKQAKNIITAFLMGRLGFLSGVMMLLCLSGFIASMKHNILNLEENIEQLVIASKQKGETLAGEILGNFVSWGITFLLFGIFLIFAIITYKSFF